MPSETFNNYSKICDSNHPEYNVNTCDQNGVEGLQILINAGAQQIVTNAITLTGLGLPYTLPTMDENVVPYVVSELGGTEGNIESVQPETVLPGTETQQNALLEAGDQTLQMPILGDKDYVAPTYAQALDFNLDQREINITEINGTNDISYSITNPNTDFATSPAMSMREAINRSPAEEEAVLFLFDYNELPYNEKITLSELLLLAAGFERNIPIGSITAPLISASLPSAVDFNFVNAAFGLDGIDTVDPVVTVSDLPLGATSVEQPDWLTTPEMPHTFVDLAIEGSGGFLWKPISEGDGNLVILLPSSLRGGQIDTCTISGSFGSESGTFTNDVHNGFRPHYRFDNPGASYGANITVTVDLLTATTIYEWTIPNGAQRTENIEPVITP